MSEEPIVIAIKGDDRDGVKVKNTLDSVAKSGDKAVVSLGYFVKELQSGQVTVQKFTEKMKNAGQSTEKIDAEIKKLGISQAQVKKIIESTISPLERLARDQDMYNKYVRAGAIDQATFAKATANTQAQIKRIQAEQSKTNQLFGQAKNLLFAYIGVQTVIQIVKVADEFQNMRNRIQNLTKDTGETKRVMDSLIQTANKTGTALSEGLNAFTKITLVKDSLKATNDQILQFTDTFIKLGVIGGASQAELNTSLTQVGQLLAVNKARTQEWRSIMQATPAVGTAIARELGVTTGEMQNLIAKGKVLSKDVFAAMLNASKEANENFKNMPLTAGRGFNELKNDLSVIVDQINQAVNGTNTLGRLFQGVGSAAKMIYDGLSTTFDFIVAGLTELVNGFMVVVNKMIEGINWIKRSAPGWMHMDSSQMDLMKTVDVGSVFSAANQARKEREANLFKDTQDETQTFAKRLEYSKDYRKEADKLNAAGEVDLEQKKAQKAALAEQKKQQQELTSAINGSRTQQEKLNDEIAHLEKLKGVAKTSEEIALLNRGIRNTQAELDKLRVQVELDSPMAKAFKNIADEIQDGFKDAFKNAFSEENGGNAFKKLLAGFKASFKNMLAELAYQAAAKPILVSILGVGGSALGLSSGALASILGTGAGGSSGSSGGGLSGLNFSSISQGFSSINGLLNGAGGAGLVNTIGHSLGFAQVLPAGVYGPAAPGALFGSATLGGTLAGGSIGSLAASLLGLGSSNGLVNMGLGTAGAVIGSVGGPIGSAIGSFIGTALGGLFGGGKPSDMAQGGNINFETGERATGGQTGKKFSQANATFRDSIMSEVDSLAALLRSVGGKLTGGVHFTVGSRDGLRISDHYTNVETNYGKDSTAFVKAILQSVVDQTTGLSATFKTILDKLGVGDTQKLAAGFQFGQYYDALNAGPVDQVAAAIEALNTQFDSLRAMATELGFPLDKINADYEKQKEAITGVIKAQEAGFDSLMSMTQAFKGFLDGQALGDNSSLNPLGKLDLAQGNFNSLLATAKGGDLSVTQQLLAAAGQLLDIGRGVYASSEAFSTLESFVRGSITDIAHAAGVPGYAVGTGGAAGGFAMVGERGRELVNFGGGEQVFTAGQTAGIMAMSGNAAADVLRSNAVVASLMVEMNDTAKDNKSEMTRLRKAFERLANKMAVLQ